MLKLFDITIFNIKNIFTNDKRYRIVFIDITGRYDYDTS